MEKIKTIEALVYELGNRERSGSKILEIMKKVEIPREEYEPYLSWNDDNYTRNVLARNEDFELILVCWEKGQSSPIHDFNSQEAWIHPVIGWLREERFKINPGDDTKLEKVSSVLLCADEYTYMNQVGIHRYSNAFESRSVSLNVYAKPVKEWHVYDEETSDSVMQETWVNKDFNLLNSKESV